MCSFLPLGSCPRHGLGQSRRCGLSLCVAQRWLSLQSPLLSAGADLLSTLCRHGFLPIPLLISLCFCHRNAKRCRNMSALKSLQPPFTPKAAKEHRSVCFRLLLCNLSKGFIKIIVSPFMRQETVEFKISLRYIVREGST